MSQPERTRARSAAMLESVEAYLTGSTLPPRLADLDAPPQGMFLRGELPRGPAVAIVGTRHPSARASEYAGELAGGLARAGVAVLSGGAELFREVVARGGAYLSLVEAHVPATQVAFFPRNACLVALAHVLVIVESPIRSGARNAAAHARRLGRPCFVVAYPPWHSNGLGCLAELLLGARPLSSVKDLFKALAAQNLHTVSTVTEPCRSTQTQQEILNFSDVSTPGAVRAAVFSAIQRGAASADEICLATGLSAARVSELILTLRLEGVLVTHPSGRLKIDKLLI